MEYIPLRAVTTILALLPLQASLKVGRGIGWIVYKIMSGRAGIAHRNISASFPGISEEKIQSIIRGSWENLGAGVSEFAHLTRMSSSDVKDYTVCEGLEHIQKSYDEGKGTLLLTAHYGAWDFGFKFWPWAGIKTAAIVRRVKNPYVNDLVTKIRENDGVKVFLSKNGVREGIRWLKAGNQLAVLVDHRVTEGGLKVQFFGRPASTTSFPGILALRFKVPVHPMRCWRENGKVRFEIFPAMDFSDLSSNEEGVAEATLRMSQVVEGWIRERPQEWLWIHNRWKMDPAPAA